MLLGCVYMQVQRGCSVGWLGACFGEGFAARHPGKDPDANPIHWSPRRPHARARRQDWLDHHCAVSGGVMHRVERRPAAVRLQEPGLHSPGHLRPSERYHGKRTTEKDYSILMAQLLTFPRSLRIYLFEE